MKSNILYLFIAIVFLASCKKNEEEPQPTPEESYINATEGSTWTYHEVNKSGGETNESDFTVTSTSEDTSINSKTYHIYDYSFGGSQYLNVTGNSYYQYDSIPGSQGQVFERLYLKADAAVGATWEQTLNIPIPGFPITIPVTVTNEIIEKGISHTVNSTVYEDVIHVSVTISSSQIPSGLTSDIHSYYAKKYGLIENTTKVDLSFMGIEQHVDLSTKLTSSVLK